MKYRIEKDTLGEVEVPADVYYGPQTQRSVNNFKIATDISRMPEEVIEAFAYLKKGAALANKDAGVLSPEKCELIGKVCDEILAGKLNDSFPLIVWQTGSGTQTNMNVNEVIANRAHVLTGGKLTDKEKVLLPNDDVNKSQSSNDTFPSAMHIAAYKVIAEVTIPGLESLYRALALKSEEFMKIVKIGRTPFMDATPLTLGQEFSGYAAQLEYGIRKVKDSLSHISELALGGTAVGTGINAPVNYDECVAKKISELTGLPFVTAPNKFEALATHDALVEAHGALKSVAVSLMKIANDIRMLGSGPRAGIGEIHLPENEPGSSIMPGKVNPVIPEVMNQVSYKVIGNDLCVAMSGEAAQMELNAMEPVMAQCCFESADLLMNGFDTLRTLCIDGITANEEKCRRDVHNSIGVVTALNPVIGYKHSTKIAREALETGKGVYELVLEHNILSKEDLDTILKPENMIKPVKLDIHPNH